MPLPRAWIALRLWREADHPDMRISVELILSLLTQGVTTDAILRDYPELEPEDIRACTAYAHAVPLASHWRVALAL